MMGGSWQLDDMKIDQSESFHLLAAKSHIFARTRIQTLLSGREPNNQVVYPFLIDMTAQDGQALIVGDRNGKRISAPLLQ